ncbi:MAG: DUF11 domain-containing protein [bacterium]|nr:DUF11 domain-containing protein [bacterium]
MHNCKRRTPRRSALLAAFVLIASILPFDIPGAQLASAEAGPPTVETYIVPLPEEDIRGGSLALYASTHETVHTVISVTSAVDGTIVYYDHWEDGYELDLSSPAQATTEIWGDGVVSNGAPPGCLADVCDTFGAGDNAALINDVFANPRDPVDVFYDGGDRIGATGPVAVTRAGWALDPGTLLAGAVEVYPTDAWGTSYEVPMGEDSALGENFEYTAASIMAAHAGTTVSIDADGDTIVDQTFTLGAGASQLVAGLDQSATIAATGPIQVDLLTGDVGATYAGRWYALLPTTDWADSYFNPVGTSTTDGPSVVVLYNPTGSQLDVTVDYEGGSTTVSVASKDVATYQMPASGARFSAATEFYATVVVDYDDTASDWGFTLVPETRLSTAAVVGWGPGSNDPATENSSPVWVTAEGATDLYVDYDGDPTTGALTDGNGAHYDVLIPVVAYQMELLYDTNDSDQTGLKVYTLDGTRIAVAYGQDPDTASGGSPAIDLGTAVVPLLLVALGKIGSLSGDTNGNGVLDAGEFITYTVTIRNDGTASINPAMFDDVLDPYTTYVPGTSSVDGGSLADAGVTPFPFDEGGYDLGPIVPGQIVVITYDVQLDEFLPDGMSSIVNNAQLNSVGISVEGTSVHPVFDPYLDVAKTSDVPISGAIPGDTITYSIVVENTSNTPQDQFTIADAVPLGTTYVAESTVVVGSVTTTVTYADDMESGGYGGSTGSVLWGPDWTEINESDGVNSGDERIITNGSSLVLRVQDNDGGGEGVSRAINLAGYDTATLSFDFARSGFDNTNDYVVLEATDGGGGWDQLGIWEGPGSDPAFLPTSHSLDAYLTAGAAIRFVTSSNLGGSDRFMIDNVVISASTIDPETRTNASADPAPLADGASPNLLTPADPFSLDPGETMTITYQVEVANPLVVDITELTNTVYAASEQQPVFTTASVTDPIAFPELSLSKGLLGNADEDVSGDVTIGDTLTYQFIAENTGDTDLVDVAVTDPMPGLSALSCLPLQPAALAMGESLTCTATYQVVQGDVNASRIDNVATATAVDPADRPVSDIAAETVPINPVPAVTLAKSLQTDIAGTIAGDTFDYDFSVTNTGNVDLTDVVVTDPLLGGVVGCPQTTLSPNESMTCAASYTVTQSDVDDGQVANTATVTAVDPTGDPVTDDDDELAILEQNPSIDLTKALQGNADEDGSGSVSLADTLTYRFVATNDGNVTLNAVGLTDPLPGLGPLSCIPTPGSSLLPGEQMVCTATYGVTQSDVNAGVIENTATVVGTAVTGADVTDQASESVSTSQDPSITLSKSFIANADEDVSGDVSLSDTLTYRFDVVNDGNVSLTVVTITDPLPGMSVFSCGADTLPVTMIPGGTISCTATYTVTQPDVDAGRIDNTATATGFQPNGLPISDSDDEVVFPDRNPSIDLTKTLLSNADEDGSGDVSLGDTITYRFVAENDGDVGLDNVGISDPLPGLSPLGCTPAPGSSLAPTAAMTCTATYVVTQADVDAGEILNTGTANGDDSGGGGAVTDQDSVTVSTAQNPSINIVKSFTTNTDEDGSADVSLGDTLTYEMVVQNSGDVTLSNIAVDDPLTGGPVACPLPTLAPGASMTCTTTYAVLQTDIDAGSISNTATVTADEPGGNPLTDTDDELIGPPQNPSIVLLKTLLDNADDDGSGDLSVGDTLTYQFAATNDGDVTLGLVTITDPKPGLSPLSCAPVAGSSLATGDTMTCTASYAVTQSDVDDGVIDNTGSVAAERPGGDPGDPGDDVSDDDDHSVVIPAEPAIDLTKTMSGNADDDGSGDVSVGDTLSYEFVVQNVGNVTLTTVAVADPLVGTVSCPVATLAPGASTTCTAAHVVDLADADAGFVINTATATGTDPHGTDVSDDDAVATPVVVNPTISLIKTLQTNADEDGSGGISIGDTLTYGFVATNDGDVTLSAVRITDPLAGLSALSCAPSQPASLAPGETITCSATYTVTQLNIDQGQILNTATAQGLAPDSTLVSDQDSVAVSIYQNASISLHKFVADNADEDVSGGITRDDTLTYQFVATNTGNVTLVAASISDPLSGLSALACNPAQPAVLVPGATLVCTAEYSVTQADLDAAAISNTATVNAVDPNSTPVTDTDGVVTPIEGSPSILLDKYLAGNADEDGTGDISLGDTLTYGFDVENTGDVTLTGVTVTDPMPSLGPISCVPAQGTTLAPGATMSCTADYTVTATDTAGGQIENTATVVGLAPAGTPTSDDDTETLLTAQADISLFKSVYDSNPNVGDPVVFIISIVNDGPDTATNLVVSDHLPAGLSYENGSIAGGNAQDDASLPTLSWSIDAMASGATTNLTYTAVVATPTGVPDEYENVAEVTASDTLDPDSTPDNDDGDQSEDDEDSAQIVPQSADLSLVKTVSDSTPNVGDTVVFTITVDNAGTDDATGVAVTDVVPAGFGTIANASHSGVIAGTTVTWTGLAVAAGGSIALTFEAVVNAPPGSYENAAQISATDQLDPDSTPGNDDGDQSEDDEDAVTVAPQQADLEIAKSVSIATPNVGDSITFTVAVTNAGPSDASGVDVVDVVPDGYNAITAISHGGAAVGATITWSGLSVPSGATVALTFDVVVDAPTGAPGEYRNTAQVTASDQFDPDSTPGNDDGDQSEDDEDEAVATPQVADLSLVKAVSDTTPLVDEVITFTLTINNAGPDAATGVAVSDQVPNGYTSIANVSDSGTVVGSVVSWSGLTVPAGGSVSVTFDAAVVAPPAAYINMAEVTASDQFDPDSTPGNDDGNQSEDDEDNVGLTPTRSDLELVKTVSDPVPNVGDTVTFTITVTNQGPDDATGIQVTDVIPAGYSAASAISAGGSLAGSVISWTGLAASSGDSVVLTFDAVVDEPTGVVDEYLNTAQVADTDQFDPDSSPGNDDGDQSEDDEDSALVAPRQADLELVKSVPTTTPNVGDVITFTLSVSNKGANTATGVLVSDSLPSGYSYQAGSIAGGDTQNAAGNPDLTWSIGAILPGETVDLTFAAAVLVGTGVTDEFRNTAEIADVDQFDPDSSPGNDDGDQSEDDEDFASVAPQRIDLSLAKTVSDPAPNVGSDVTFTIRVTNAGPDDATGAAVADTVPNGYSAPSAISNGGGAAGSIVSWSGLTIPAGWYLDLTFMVTVDSPSADYMNVAEVTAADQHDTDSTPGNDDGDQSEDDEDAAAVAPQVIDLSLQKTISDSNANVGQTVTFNVTVTNEGPDDATGVSIADTVPAGFAGVDAISTGGIETGSTITWSGLAIAAGSSVVLSFDADVMAPTGLADEYRNVAEVVAATQFDVDSTPGNDDGDQSEDDEDSAVATPPVADLRLVKSVSDANPGVGGVVTYTVTVTNDGPADATGVAVADGVPAGLTGITAISGGGTFAASTITWSGFSVPAGSSVPFTFDATVLAPTGASGEYVNIVQVVAGDQFDPDSVPNNDDGDQSEDDEDSAQVSPREIDLSLAKTVSAATPNVGDTVTFTVRVANAGPDDATGVAIEDSVPAGYAAISGVTAGGIVAGSTVTWNSIDIAAGAYVDLSFDAAVAAPPADHVNIAEVVAADQYDSDSAPNNDDGDQSEDDEDNALVVPQQVDLSLVKSVSDPTPNVGDTVVFTISLHNAGPDVATAVTVTDSLPSGFVYNAGSISGGDSRDAAGDPTLVWSVTSLASGAGVDLTFAATVAAPSGAPGEFVNTAEVTAVDQFDSDSVPGNDDGDQSEDDEDAAAVVPRIIDLSLAKSVSDPMPNVGDTVSFTITVGNDGPSDASDVAIVDTLPAGLTDVSNISAGGTEVGGQVTWAGIAVASGGSLTLTFDALVAAPVGGPNEYRNVAEVTAATQHDTDSTPGNDDGDQSEDDESNSAVVPQQADLSVTKDVDEVAPVAGSTVLFSIVVANDGPGSATGVTVVDELPSGFVAATAISNGGVLAGSTITWSGLTIAAGSAITLTFEVTVATPTGTSGEFLNVAQIVGVDQFDPDSTPDNDDGDQSEDDEDSAAVTPAVLGLAKSVGSVVNHGDGTYSVSYLLTVENLGDVVIDDLELFDDVAAQFAALDARDFSASDGAFLANPAWDGTGSVNMMVAGQKLDPGEIGTIYLAMTVTPGADIGPHENVAYVAGLTPTDGPVGDDSTDGIDPDVDGDDDDGTVDEDDVPDEDTPTPVSFAEAPLLGVAKTVSADPVGNGDGSYNLTYTVAVENFGDVALNGIQVADNLAATFELATSWELRSIDSDSLTVSPTYDGDADTQLLVGSDTLIVGEIATIQIRVTVTPGSELGPHRNSAIATGRSPVGTGVTDVSQDGVDPDPDGNGDPADNNDPTPVAFPALGGVSGAVWNDEDGDGLADPAEDGIPDVTVQLIDPGPDGNVGSADDVLISISTTAADGSYSLDDVPAGNYVVFVDRSTLPWVVQNTFDPDGVLDGMTDVFVVSGEVSTDNDFGYVGQFNVSLVKTAVGEAELDSPIDFLITVTNAGPATALGPVTVVDVVPEELSVVAAHGDRWDCAVQDRAIECVLDGDLTMGVSAAISVETMVIAQVDNDIVNTAEVTVTGPVPELDLSDNVDSATVPVGELPYTGSDLLRFAVIGLLLLAAGAALVAITGRRQSSST